MGCDWIELSLFWLLLVITCWSLKFTPALIVTPTWCCCTWQPAQHEDTEYTCRHVWITCLYLTSHGTKNVPPQNGSWSVHSPTHSLTSYTHSLTHSLHTRSDMWLLLIKSLSSLTSLCIWKWDPEKSSRELSSKSHKLSVSSLQGFDGLMDDASVQWTLESCDFSSVVLCLDYRMGDQTLCSAFSCWWVSGWVGEWVSEWVSEWVDEWVSEWVIEWVSVWGTCS